MVALAGCNTQAHCDVPVNGHGVALHEASRPHMQAHADWGFHVHVLVCHLERLLADSRLPRMMPADVPEPVPPHCFGMLSLEHPSCAQGQILMTGRDFAASLGFALLSKELLGVADLYGRAWRAKWPWPPQGIHGPLIPLGLGATLLSPQMAMLLKLQEAANYIESPDRETMVDPDLQSTL